MGVRLPREYQEVEYIQGNITKTPAYIDTLYVPTVNTKLRVKFSPVTQNQYGFFGARKDPYRFYCATFGGSAVVSCGMTINSWPSTRVTFVVDSIYDCIIENGHSEINGTEITTTAISSQDWSETVGTIQLRALQDASFGSDSTAKYYLCQIWENGILVRDFVPCYRKSDNEIGMYDLVEMTFYTNAGVGSFTAGPIINYHNTGGFYQLMSLLMAQPHKESVVGANGIATFNTDFKAPVKIVIPFSPIRDGSGDPSPENIRSISGFTGCRTNVSGSNVVFPPPIRQINNCAPDSTGKLTYSGYSHTLVMPIPKGLLYLYKQANGSELTVGFSNNSSLAVGDTTEDALYTKWGTTYQYTNVYKYAYVTINRADSNPHFSISPQGYIQSRTYGNGVRISITFTDPSTGDPMTIYGGTLTVYENGTGRLVRTYIYREMSKFSSISAPSGSGKWAHLFNLKNWTTTWDKAAGTTNMMCDVCKTVSDATTNYTICGISSTADMYVYDDTISTVAEFKEKYAGHYIAYVAVNSSRQTYNLTAEQVGQLMSFIGTNNVWSDLNGNPTVTYWKHG